MNAPAETELSIPEVVEVLRRWLWPIVAFIALLTGGTCVASFLLPKRYDALLVLSPVTNSETSGLLSNLNSVMSQFSGLATLAGLSTNTDSTKAESLAVLESEALTEEYVRKNDLLPILFHRDWNDLTHTWKQTDPKRIPTLWKANQLFKKQIRTVTSDKGGLVTLTIKWEDAKTAAKWANDLVRLTNDYRRDKAIRESERNIAYLTAEAGKTDVVGVKQAIFSVLQQEISKMMLAKGNDEYALKVIDPAEPPEKSSSPQPVIWTLIAFFVSLTIALGGAFSYVALRGQSSGGGASVLREREN